MFAQAKAFIMNIIETFLLGTATGPLGSGYRVGLYGADITADANTTLEELEEVESSTYARIEVDYDDTPLWNGPYQLPTGEWEINARAMAHWDGDAAVEPPAQLVYGWFLLDANDNLVGAQRFANPIMGFSGENAIAFPVQFQLPLPVMPGTANISQD